MYHVCCAQIVNVALFYFLNLAYDNRTCVISCSVIFAYPSLSMYGKIINYAILKGKVAEGVY